MGVEGAFGNQGGPREEVRPAEAAPVPVRGRATEVRCHPSGATVWRQEVLNPGLGTGGKEADEENRKMPSRQDTWVQSWHQPEIQGANGNPEREPRAARNAGRPASHSCPRPLPGEGAVHTEQGQGAFPSLRQHQDPLQAKRGGGRPTGHEDAGLSPAPRAGPLHPRSLPGCFTVTSVRPETSSASLYQA